MTPKGLSTVSLTIAGTCCMAGMLDLLVDRQTSQTVLFFITIASTIASSLFLSMKEPAQREKV